MIKMRKSSIAIVICLTILIAFSTAMIAMGAVSLDGSNRREYTWCPINDQLAKTNVSIEGCPIVRIYVNDWSRLTPLQQTTIDTQLRTLGFVDAGEHVIR